MSDDPVRPIDEPEANTFAVALDATAEVQRLRRVLDQIYVIATHQLAEPRTTRDTGALVNIASIIEVALGKGPKALGKRGGI